MSKGSHDANIAMPFNNIQVSALDSSTSVHHSCVVWCGEGSDWEVRDKVTTTRKKLFLLSISSLPIRCVLLTIVLFC